MKPTRQELISDYKAELGHFSKLPATAEVSANVSFTKHRSTAGEQVEICTNAIKALEAGAEIDPFIY